MNDISKNRISGKTYTVSLGTKNLVVHLAK